MSEVAGVLLSPAAAAAGLFKKPKARPVVQPRPITRNLAAEAARQGDLMRKRRGAGANELTGPGGAEAQTPGGKTLLGQ